MVDITKELAIETLKEERKEDITTDLREDTTKDLREERKADITIDLLLNQSIQRSQRNLLPLLFRRRSQKFSQLLTKLLLKRLLILQP